MTYCLGWKTQTCAYLVADTAVTSGRVPSTRLSSFGEAHVYEATKNVEEGALKIISARGAGITFCGNAKLGRDVVDTFRMALAAGLAPSPAFQTAIASNVNSGDRVDLECSVRLWSRAIRTFCPSIAIMINASLSTLPAIWFSLARW